ncbi:hypothetical protein [Jiella sonneratiae]|uniref:N-acetyltransferase domain-containing protein n=1 Tax=Jiella sonneratiae TaxID=2816856 RepID=A0ABS3J7A5_9HYPH|nr:hypothetical protein [Jiella sonneratiae]MBO0905537.1 hypothetical protein [Jiella sonneratiae]
MSRWNPERDFDVDRFKGDNRLTFVPQWSDEAKDWWREHIFEPHGLYPDEFADVLTKSVHGDRSVTYFGISPESDSFVVKVVGSLGDPGEAWWTERGLDLRGKAFHAREMVIPERSQGQGIGRHLMGDLFDMALRMRIERIDIEAQDIGRYAWIRAGFLPDNTGWRYRLRPEIRDRLAKARSSLSDENYRYYEAALDSDDPKIVREIASWEEPVPSRERTSGGEAILRPLGRVLLLEILADWCGSFDLRDPTSLEIYENYARRTLQR